MKKYFYLAGYGAAFATRAKGAEMGDKIGDILASLNEDDALLIDFKGVEALSYSFVDELFVRVIEVSQQKENTSKSITVAGWSVELLTVLDQTLHRRKCSLAPSTSSLIKEKGERILKCSATVA